MRFFQSNLGNALARAATIVALGITGCSNSCFIVFSSNGSSGVVVRAGDPAPVCSLTPANGTIRAVALKSPICESCTAAAKVEHVFVTVRSIQLRPSAIVDAESSNWPEIAPYLAGEPRQLDLIGRSGPEILVEAGVVPAGSYSAVRLQFLPEPPSNSDGLPTQNACGDTRSRWNCVVTSEGRVEPLRWPGDPPELLIFPGGDSEALLVLPDSKMDLQLSLELRRVLYFSSTEGLKPQNALAGRATVVRHIGM